MGLRGAGSWGGTVGARGRAWRGGPRETEAASGARPRIPRRLHARVTDRAARALLEMRPRSCGAARRAEMAEGTGDTAWRLASRHQPELSEHSPRRHALH